MRTGFLALFLIGSVLAWTNRAGSSPPTSGPVCDGIVRIMNQLEDGASVGSGTLVQRERHVGVVLTCAHLFGEGVGDLYVTAPGAKPQRALLLATDEKNDLACLVVHEPSGATVPIAEALPKRKAPLVSCGYGPNGGFRENHGRHLGYSTLSGGEALGVLEMSGFARQGDSGGPILNPQRQVVAVIIGTDGQTVDGTHCEWIRAFLKQHPLTAAFVAQAKQLTATPLSERELSFVAAFEETTTFGTEPVTPVTIRGQVTWGGRPMTGVRARLSGSSPSQVNVDAKGRFVFEQVPAGSHRLEVETIVHNMIRRARHDVLISPATGDLTVALRLE